MYQDVQRAMTVVADELRVTTVATTSCVVILVVMTSAAAGTGGAHSVRMALEPGSSIRVDGKSNIHAWHATSTEITATIQVTPPIAESTVESVTIALPVTSLKSGTDGLDKNLYKALNAEKNPTISFVMRTYNAIPTGNVHRAVITGVLTVNGVEKELRAEATMSTDGKGGLKAVGTSDLKMTDFGVKPVTALFGTIRTADAITVRFDLAGTAADAIAQLPRE
jgi:polyisoprenoid-binding protein YceI